MREKRIFFTQPRRPRKRWRILGLLGLLALVAGAWFTEGAWSNLDFDLFSDSVQEQVTPKEVPPYVDPLCPQLPVLVQTREDAQIWCGELSGECRRMRCVHAPYDLIVLDRRDDTQKTEVRLECAFASEYEAWCNGVRSFAERQNNAAQPHGGQTQDWCCGWVPSSFVLSTEWWKVRKDVKAASATNAELGP
jgi:hypothetical protein